MKSGDSPYFKHSTHKCIYTFNSNIFLLLKQIPGSIKLCNTQFPTPPATTSTYQPNSLLLACSVHIWKGLHVHRLFFAHTDNLLCPCISFQYRSFTPGSKELLSYYLREDYQKPLTDFRSFLAINKLVLLAGERQEVSHTFLITQMQNSWDSSKLKGQEMGVEASHNIKLPASLYILHVFLSPLSRKDIKE